MELSEFDSLIDSLTESVKDYNLDDSFDYWDAIHEICSGCDYSFVYYKAWLLVDFVRTENRDLFDEAEDSRIDLDHNSDTVRLDDIILNQAFHILKTATLEKWEELQTA